MGAPLVTVRGTLSHTARRATFVIGCARTQMETHAPEWYTDGATWARHRTVNCIPAWQLRRHSGSSSTLAFAPPARSQHQDFMVGCRESSECGDSSDERAAVQRLLAASDGDRPERTGSPGAGGPLSAVLKALAVTLRSIIQISRYIFFGRTPLPLQSVQDELVPKSGHVVVHNLTPFITIGRDRPFAISPCSDLYKATLLENVPVVVRRIRFQDDETGREPKLRSAAAVLVGAQHVNVLLYIGTCEFEGSLCIVSAFAPGGDLRKHLATHEDCDRRSLLTQVARGLLYLHQSGIVHGNLHPRNVLLADNGTIKVSDFGLADIIPDEGTTSMRPTFAREKAMHRAPETHMGSPLSRSSDVYSFAMLVFHAYSDTEPMLERYPGAIQVVAALMSGQRPPRREITRSGFSDNLWDVVQRCWVAEAEKRLPMSVVVEAISKDMPAVL